MITAKPEEAVVHPLVLLNCVDHYNRVAKNTSKRVVGVLLGRSVGGTVDITKYVVNFLSVFLTFTSPPPQPSPPPSIQPEKEMPVFIIVVDASTCSFCSLPSSSLPSY